jgi:hypothetical protein
VIRTFFIAIPRKLKNLKTTQRKPLTALKLFTTESVKPCLESHDERVSLRVLGIIVKIGAAHDHKPKTPIVFPYPPRLRRFTVKIAQSMQVWQSL